MTHEDLYSNILICMQGSWAGDLAAIVYVTICAVHIYLHAQCVCENILSLSIFDFSACTLFVSMYCSDRFRRKLLEYNRK